MINNLTVKKIFLIFYLKKNTCLLFLHTKVYNTISKNEKNP